MNYEKILVIAPAWIGDLVMAQSLFKHLKLINPRSQIDVIAPAWNYLLLQRMPEVTQAIQLNCEHGELGLNVRYQLGKSLRGCNYDAAIILPNSWKSALIPWVAKIPNRIGWCGEFRFGLINDIRFLNKIIYTKMVERYVVLAYSKATNLPKKLCFPKLTVDFKNLEKTKFKFLSKSYNNKLPVLALGVGAAFGEAKCWPEDYFLTLAYIVAKIHKFNVWIFGTSKNLNINTSLPNIINFSGKTNLLETIDLLYLSDIVVCNDSGLMHIAASLSKKIIAIYGPTTEEFTPPLCDTYKVINKHLSCSPCFARTCRLKHHNCMRQITVDEVLAQIKLYANIDC